MEDKKTDIYDVLDRLGIVYVKHEHPAVFTCEEAEPYYAKMKGGHSKNLFLRNKKGTKHYLVVIESSKKADLKKLENLLRESGLSFASPDRLMKYLGLTPGSVSPFGLINDLNKEVAVIVDKGLLVYDYLNYHPNINTATLEVGREDFEKFLEWCGNEVKFVEL